MPNTPVRDDIDAPRSASPERVLRGAVLGLTLALALPACDGSDPAGPAESTGPPTLTVNAKTGWAYARLGEPAAAVQVVDARTSADWDIAFFATAVMLNGGAAGPAGVVGYCVCQNEAATNAQVMGMTPESELSAFETIAAASIPADGDAWSSDALSPAIDGWYRYDPVTHVVSAAPDRVWKVRAAESSSPVFAKLHVVELIGSTQQHAGRVVIEYAVQSAPGAALGAVRRDTVDVAAGRVHYDLSDGDESDATDWDLAFEGWTIRVNGGVSGPGTAGAVLAGEPFGGITDAGDVPAQVYRGDAFGGVFDDHRWYRYDLAGNHQIWPTYDVFLIKRGSAVYKVQLTGYYGAAGEDRQITFRYERIAG